MTAKPRKRKTPMLPAPPRHNIIQAARLHCATCCNPCVITATGLICGCPGVYPHGELTSLRKKYPKQVSVSPLDRDELLAQEERRRA